MNRPLIQKQWMLLTISPQPPKCPPETLRKIRAQWKRSVRWRCSLPTRSCVSPKGEGVAVRKTNTVPSFMGVRRGVLPQPEP